MQSLLAESSQIIAMIIYNDVSVQYFLLVPFAQITADKTKRKKEELVIMIMVSLKFVFLTPIEDYAVPAYCQLVMYNLSELLIGVNKIRLASFMIRGNPSWNSPHLNLFCANIMQQKNNISYSIKINYARSC